MVCCGYALINVNPHLPHPGKDGILALMTLKKDKMPHLWGKMTGQNPH